MPRLVGYNEVENIRVLKEEYGLGPPLEELVQERRVIYAHSAGELEAITVFPGILGDDEGGAAAWVEAGGGVLERAISGGGAAAAVVRGVWGGESDPERYFDTDREWGGGGAGQAGAGDLLAGTGAIGDPGRGVPGLRGYAGRGDGGGGRRVDGVRGADTIRGAEFPGAEGVLGSLEEGVALLEPRNES